ncbi:MAG: hypothetical protein M1818_000897 [Claussenomyces sp. TS43310]|nr:MAG: hypothetical protein M1818_000897 [Claussenomyces sp. TS43310]
MDSHLYLEHYQLASEFPAEWPIEKDQSDASDEEDLKELPNGMRRSKSRYSALERASSGRKSLVPGSQKSGGGIENLVQKDEPDPLGTAGSVVAILKQQGLPVQDDIHLRNRFLLSSTTFSPALFLSRVHSTASTQSLLQGLDVLSRSIDQKSASLKVLVESNFERFVRAKATIDNVYMEMKNRGADHQQNRPHSRHASRNSFRNSSSSGNVISTNLTAPPIDGKKKHALVKESEYGLLGIKTPLIDVSAKAEEVWGPALGRREKEEALKGLTGTLEQYRECYEVGIAIVESIRRKDYGSLVAEYVRARRLADDAKRLADILASTKTTPTEAQVQQLLITARMWNGIEEQLEEFKRDIWRRLTAVQTANPQVGPGYRDQHIELISILLELGVQDNPIWVWLLSRYDHLKTKIQSSSDRSKVEIEVLRRRLANGSKPTPQVTSAHLKLLGRQGFEEKLASHEAPDVIEAWERMYTFLTSMLSPQGVLGEITDFWHTVQGVLEGRTQKTLPVGINGESRKHHRLSVQGSSDLQKGTIELINMIRESVYSFFVDPPIEDISLLFSPIPPTPGSPSPVSLSPTVHRDPRFAFDASHPPPSSPRMGEAWEKFAFWPPWSNSISGVHYLGKFLALIGSGASDMATLATVGNGDGSTLERLRGLVGGAREKCVTAICAAWNKDAENIKVLEDWKRSPDKTELTRMPANFNNIESAILSGMQKILYVSEAMTKPGSEDVVLPPPPKILQMVRSQFVTTLYKALSGMVENAEMTTKKEDDDWTMETSGSTSPVTMATATSMDAEIVNAGDRDVRMLLTLNNLHALRVDIVPNLTTQFEFAFSVKLTDEAKTIRDVLGQIDARLFQSYTRPTVEELRRIIRTGISAPNWAPPASQKPKNVRPYVQEALLSLVRVHTEVSTTAPSLTPQVLSYLLEQISRELLDAFQQRSRYSLPALMQATLDVEFIAQTLSQYTTDKAGEIQSQIYQELDRGTDNEARLKLQNELPEMRAVLKKLREGSKSKFASLKKNRRGIGRVQTA